VSARRALASARVLALAGLVAAGPGAAQVNVMGPCVEGHRWVSTALAPVPLATYAACEPVVPFVTVTCSGGGLWMRVDYPFQGVEPGTASVQAVAVDGREFPVRMALRAAALPGQSFAEFRLETDLIEALMRGVRAQLRIGASRPEMHLAASNDALTVLTRHC